MESLPQDLLTVCLLVLVMGLKHGFDADHLAAIDSLTRFNAQAQPRLARYCGALFSLGHGVIVIAIALIVSTLTERWSPPGWLSPFAAWVSSGILFLLGLLNLRAAFQTAPGQIVQTVGVKGRFLGWSTRASNPLTMAMVGALFAISFDTISQASLFALTASRFGGPGYALMLGLLFTLGMLTTDGANGWWVARLIERADQHAARASRLMALAIGFVSLAVGLYGMVKMASPVVDAWGEGHQVFMGGGVVATIGLFYVAGMRSSRPTFQERH